MSPHDWLDSAISVSLALLAVERWIRGRERTDANQFHDIARIDRDIKDMKEEIKGLHKKASDMGDEMVKKCGELSTKLAVSQNNIDNIYSLLDRRSHPRS